MLDLHSIKNKLRKKNIFLDEKSLKLHSEQGMVNEVYIVDSNIGKLIIHIGKLSEKDVQIQKVKRIFSVSKFIKENSDFPISEVITFGKDNKGHAFLVQNFVEGKKLSNVKNKTKYIKQLAKYVADLHQIPIKGGGCLKYELGKIRGCYKNWFVSLKKSSYTSLKNIYEFRKSSDTMTKKDYQRLKLKLKKFFKNYKNYFINVKGKLLHGDLKFENIIVNKTGIAAIVDLEWSSAGDPAWDFSGRKDLNQTFFNEYFQNIKKIGQKINKKEFKLRTHLAWTIRLVCIADTFKRVKNFYWAMKEFEENLNKLLKKSRKNIKDNQ